MLVYALPTNNWNERGDINLQMNGINFAKDTTNTNDLYNSGKTKKERKESITLIREEKKRAL